MRLTWQLFFFSTALASAAMIENGNFESPVTFQPAVNVPGQWSVYTSGAKTGRFTVEEHAGRGQSRGVRFTQTGTASENNHLDQVITVEPQTFYQVSAWIKGDGQLNPIIAALAMNWKALGQAPAGAGADWRPAAFLFNSGTNSSVRFEWFPAAKGQIYSGGGAGTAFLDEVSVEKIDVLPGDVKRWQELTAAKPAEFDRAAVHTGPVGDARPLRRIVAKSGLLQYEDGGEVALWGVNFQSMLSWEYEGYMKPYGVPLQSEALKKIADENLDQLVLMRYTVARVHLAPADLTDADGNLINNVWLDQLDYFLAGCRARSIYAYLTLQNDLGRSVKESYATRFPDKADWIFDAEQVAKAERYIRALLNRVNPYTKTAYRDEPALGLIEIMNEPEYYTYHDLQSKPRLAGIKTEFERWCADKKKSGDRLEIYFPEFRYTIVKRYIDRMCAAIRGTGAKQPVIWNLKWPGNIGHEEEVYQAAADSTVDAVSFCYYPGQGEVANDYWNHPKNLTGNNYLPNHVKAYRDYEGLRWLLTSRFASKAKVVYEFETFFNQSSYLYPSLARLFRSLGAQCAPMWKYSMLPGALHKGGSHYLSLLTTPEKVVSSIIAGEVMKRVPRYAAYDTAGGDSMRFDDFYLSFPDNVSVFCDGKDLMYTRTVKAFPVPVPDTIARITGTGSSPLVSYGGSGVYFITLGASTIDLELMPNVTFTQPPWQGHTSCSLDYAEMKRMTLNLPGWTAAVTVVKTAGTNAGPVAVNGPGLSFDAGAGHYQITRKK